VEFPGHGGPEVEKSPESFWIPLPIVRGLLLEKGLRVEPAERLEFAADIVVHRRELGGIGRAAVLPSDITQLYLEAGDTANAMDWLEKAFDYGDPNLPYLRLPIYDPLRTDPRFQALLRRMGLPQ